jgi:hypothetical protein
MLVRLSSAIVPAATLTPTISYGGPAEEWPALLRARPQPCQFTLSAQFSRLALRVPRHGLWLHPVCIQVLE